MPRVGEPILTQERFIRIKSVGIRRGFERIIATMGVKVMTEKDKS